MGDLAVKPATENRAAYLQSLIRDVQALERMIKEDRFEKGHQRIGAEQELCMVDTARQPSSLAFSLLPDLPRDFTFEIGQFNLEANLSPYELNNSALQKTEDQLRALLTTLKEVGAPQGIQPIITGILPTIRRQHLDLEHMTPLERFDVLNQGHSISLRQYWLPQPIPHCCLGGSFGTRPVSLSSSKALIPAGRPIRSGTATTASTLAENGYRTLLCNYSKIISLVSRSSSPVTFRRML